ncbi:glycoside hydrolase family 18 protein [Dongshaea marina]|uniref:glycosyl hydrolase family 18 protein n=1 Tax=Dongshaea marina TaxID=2047966 RepID=UPI000D3E7968|nr:glycosyl hydrolase family 18 protein [Dongshaea marina]
MELGSYPKTCGTSRSFVGTDPTWAFASGSCSAEKWGWIDPQQSQYSNFVSYNIQQFQQHDLEYIISTGGLNAPFICDSAGHLQQFLSRYDSPNFAGLDFDIEKGYDQNSLHQLMQAAAQTQKNWAQQGKTLRVSLTLASSGKPGYSVNEMGDTAIKEAQAAGLNFVVNLMTMDFGNSRCVLGDSGQCDMAQSSIAAARELNSKYAIPLSRIALTPMIGQNDTQGEITSTQDIQTITQWAKTHELAGLHFWSFDRDTPSAATTSAPFAIPTGSGTNEPALGYTQAFLSALEANQ